MQITVKGKNIEVTEALREYAEKRLSKLNKYSDSIISADVTFSTERSLHIADVNIHTTGSVFRGEEKTSDMYASIDSAVEKLEKQLKKQKEKTTRKPGKAPEVQPIPNEPVEETKPLADIGLKAEITVTTRSNEKPISVKDAIMEMESKGYSFLAFINSENDRVNVVHKTQKGYNLIDIVE